MKKLKILDGVWSQRRQGETESRKEDENVWGYLKKYLSDRKLKEISLNGYIYSFKVEDKMETSWTGHKKNDVSDTFYSPHHTFRNLSHLLLFCPSVQLEADEAKLEN